MKKSGIYVLAWISICVCHAQFRHPEAQEVLKKIESLQVTEDPFYDAGLFPSQRYWFGTNGYEEDNNVFVTASISFILKLIQERTAPGDSAITQIINKARSNFYRYANRNGDVTYNFWQTIGDDLPFPNGSSLLSTKRHRLPDDYDDTVIIELVKDDQSSGDKVREMMTSYALRKDRGPVEKTIGKYKDYQAYEVLFADKMDQYYDIIVMSNVLTFVFREEYELNNTDHETIRLMKKIIEDNAHINLPEAVAPWYGTTPLILYHLARLLTFDHHGLLQDLKPRIISDIETKLLESDSEIERMLLYTSLFKLNAGPEPVLSRSKLEEEMGTFSFFRFKPPQLLGVLPVMRWKSEAYDRTLLLEFLTYVEPEWTFSE